MPVVQVSSFERCSFETWPVPSWSTLLACTPTAYECFGGCTPSRRAARACKKNHRSSHHPRALVMKGRLAARRRLHMAHSKKKTNTFTSNIPTLSGRDWGGALRGHSGLGHWALRESGVGHSRETLGLGTPGTPGVGQFGHIGVWESR